MVTLQCQMENGGGSVGKVSFTVNQVGINKRFVINMILFISVFAILVPIGDLPITCYISILGRAN